MSAVRFSFPVEELRVLGGAVDLVSLARELVEGRGVYFVIGRTVDGAVLFGDLGGLQRVVDRPARAGRLSGELRKFAQRFYVESLVACLGWAEGELLFAEAVGGRGVVKVVPVGDFAGPGVRGVVSANRVLPLDLLEQFQQMVGEWRGEVQARARRVVCLGSRVIASSRLQEVLLAQAGVVGDGVLAFLEGEHARLVAVRDLKVGSSAELEVAAQEITAFLRSGTAGVIMPGEAGVVNVVVQTPLIHETGSYLVEGGQVGRRMPFLGRNPLSFLAMP